MVKKSGASAISYQLLVISYQLSVTSYQLIEKKMVIKKSGGKKKGAVMPNIGQNKLW